MGSIPILCINVNVPIDTVVKFDTKEDANVDIEAKSERNLSPFLKGIVLLVRNDLMKLEARSCVVCVNREHLPRFAGWMTVLPVLRHQEGTTGQRVETDQLHWKNVTVRK